MKIKKKKQVRFCAIYLGEHCHSAGRSRTECKHSIGNLLRTADRNWLTSKKHITQLYKNICPNRIPAAFRVCF